METTEDGGRAMVTANRTAAEVYRDRLARARTMLRTLSALLDHHERKQRQRPDDRGFAEDLRRVNELLGEAAAVAE